jgi:biopolymer transport protein ExbD
MAFGSFDQEKSNNHAMAEINMIPLIDVMLVLLVIFMITAPLMTHSVNINLPQASSEPVQIDKDAVDLSVDHQGQLFWNKMLIDNSQFNEQLATLYASQGSQAQLHIHADKDAPYHFVASVLASASKAGITKMGFISEPEQN